MGRRSATAADLEALRPAVGVAASDALARVPAAVMRVMKAIAWAAGVDRGDARRREFAARVVVQGVRDAGARLPAEAQAAGVIRPDADGTGLFALVNAISWIAEQAPVLAERRDRLVDYTLDGLRLTS